MRAAILKYLRGMNTAQVNKRNLQGGQEQMGEVREQLSISEHETHRAQDERER